MSVLLIMVDVTRDVTTEQAHTLVAVEVAMFWSLMAALAGAHLHVSSVRYYYTNPIPTLSTI